MMNNQLTYLIVIFLFTIHCQPTTPDYNADLIINNALILSMDSAETIYRQAQVVVKNSRIIALGENPAEQYRAAKVMDAKGMMLLPGFVNTHAHSAMTIFRGLSDDHSLEDWLNKYIWPAERKFVDEKVVRLGSQLAIIEMIRSGITTFSDMYFFEDAVAEECRQVGIRALLAESLIDYPTPSFKKPEQGLKIADAQLQRWKGDSLVTVTVAVHAPYTASAELIKQAYALAETYDVPFSMHLSESAGELAQSQQAHQQTPKLCKYSVGV
ncbi:MAG: amidohydrolase family protein, partial [Bacteroidota bacterium]